jgi:hypothetical protein
VDVPCWARAGNKQLADRMNSATPMAHDRRRCRAASQAITARVRSLTALLSSRRAPLQFEQAAVDPI